jgi:precorrin-2 dehydrogenase/sirohydrochlorin ferrochelatase
MLVDLKSKGKYVVVVGAGSEGYRKTLDFLEAGFEVLVVSRSFSSNIQKLHRQGKVRLQKADVEDAEAFVSSLNPKPDLFVAVTDNHNLNAQLIRHAKSAGCMVYAPDNPSISDFTLPALAKVGDVRIAVSTAGRSPAMARVLRQRIEKMVTEEDLLQIELQNHVREALKRQISDQKTRKKLLYKILRDSEVGRLLREGKLEEAQERATNISSAARTAASQSPGDRIK